MLPPRAVDGQSSLHPNYAGWLDRTSTLPAMTVPTAATIRTTLAVCQRVVTDRDDMVVKALSWALRSLIPWDAVAVAGFLREHEEVVAGRVAREVGTKLRTSRKS